MTREQIEDTIQCFAHGARRARKAGLDGVELHAANGYLITQFLSSCTYCNKCLLNVLENPLGCYELSRYDGDRERMLREVMSVFEPSGFEESA